MPKKTRKSMVQKKVAKKVARVKVIKGKVKKSAVVKVGKPAKAKVVAKLPKAVSLVRGNLLVTYDPSHKGSASQELKDNFKAIGEKLSIEETGVEGLFRLTVSDPRKVVARLAAMCRKDHTAFAATHHYIPIDTWTRSDVAAMQSAISALCSKISDDESWKLNLAKRHWDKMGGVDLILKLTEVVDKPHVDLDSPQKIIQVEIIGDEAGISVLSPQEILDVPKIKAER